MSTENFVVALKKLISDLHRQREGLTGADKGAVTRKIREAEKALAKATRKGITEVT